MDLLRLDTSTFLPDTLVEGFTSLIWTERYRENGEFELVTGNQESTTDLIPVGTLVTLRDSPEVMIVEDHLLDRDETGKSTLTVTGRTFETFLENRALLAAVYNTPWQAYKQYKDSEFISLLLWNHLVNTTGEDPTLPNKVIDNLTAVPKVVVTDSTTLTDVVKPWTLKEGEVYKFLRDSLSLGMLGVRNIRPSGTSGNVMTFDTTRTTTRGNVSKTTVSPITNLRMDVYNGLDRTRFQNVREPVIFHYTAGHVETPRYLFSDKVYKTMAVISSSEGTTTLWPDITPPPNHNASGLSRRMLFVDGGSRGTMAINDFTNALYQKGYTELDKAKRVILFDGAISRLAPYKYGKDYFLGDQITVMGEYELENSMMVSEYTRTHDIEGERGYPGLMHMESYDSTARRRA